MTVTWHGDTAEGGVLVNAIAHNCTCQFGVMGVRLSTCTSHQAMLDDQRWLDGLLAMRHCRTKLLAQEFSS